MAQAFLIPGVWGDEPQLKALRQVLSGLVDFDLVDLPMLGAPGAIISSMRGTACFLADRITERQPTGPLSIAGYSFGASAALETACELVRRGRSIASLCVLDGPLRLEEIRQLYALLEPVTRAAAAKAVLVGGVGAVDVARRITMTAATPGRPSNPPSENLRRAVLSYLRSKALFGWQPTPCLARGLHVFTGTYGDGNRKRWAALCPNLVPFKLETEHTAIMQGASLDVISNAIVQAVETASAGDHLAPPSYPGLARAPFVPSAAIAD